MRMFEVKGDLYTMHSIFGTDEPALKNYPDADHVVKSYLM